MTDITGCLIDFKNLTAPFPPEVVSWRVGPTTRDKKKGMALAYIDARDVMERLDEVCGPPNWQCRYPHANGKTVCEIGIRCVRKVDGSSLNEDAEWVWKSDGAGDTGMEAEKGALSDAFKRAAVRWGIGRYLYDVPATWVEIEQQGNSYIIAPRELPRLQKTLTGNAAPPKTEPAAEPTESEQRIADTLISAIGMAKTTEDLKKWKTDEKQVGLFKELPPVLRTKVQAAATKRVNELNPPENLLPAG